MADLPERDQADMSFDTLYHLAKKLEAHHQLHSMMKGGASTHEPYKVYKKYSTPGGHAATMEVELFPLILSWWRAHHWSQTIWKD